MIQDRESAGYLLGETARLLRADAGLVLLALAVMTGLGIAADLFPDFTGPASFVTLVVNLVLQYQITWVLLGSYDLLDRNARGRRLWALLGLNLLSGIGILFGLILLILPGVYLLVRWSAAAPALISEGADVTGSLTRSAEAVQGRFWHVFAALLVIWTPGVAGGIASALIPEDQALIGSLLLNLPLNLALIAGWHLAVAIYAGRQGGRKLAEVFA